MLGINENDCIMKLCYLIPEFPSQTHAFFWTEIKALERANVHVHVFSTRQPHIGACNHDFANEGRQRTTYLFPPHVSALSAGLLRFILHLYKLPKYALTLQESTWRERLRVLGLGLCALELAHHLVKHSIDHVHVHSCADAAHLVAMAHLLCGCSYSLHLHGDLPVYGKDHYSKMQNASSVLTASDPLRQQVVQRIGIDPALVHTCWMGVETDHVRPPASRESSNCLRVITVARLNRTKGHEFILRALRKLLDEGRSVHYTIAGDGPWEEQIKSCVQELRLERNVTFTGTIGREAVVALLHKSDVFALGSIELGEASPVSVMEAMATGLPVVCSIIGGTPQMIDHGVDGFLIPQRDVNGIADALRALGDSELLRCRIGQAARTKAVTSFDVKATAGRLLALTMPHKPLRDTAESR